MLWGERNGVIRGHHPKTASRILESAELWLLEFKSLHQHVGPSISSCSTSLSWSPLGLTELKLKVDTVVNDSDKNVRIGAVIRDSNSPVWSAAAIVLKGFYSLYLTECLALGEDTSFALQHNFVISKVESDSKNASSALSGGVICHHISRSKIMVTHNLARFALVINSSSGWLYEVPSYVSSTVLAALIFK
ncbi:hypothetical protein PanWU01x14_330240 [Parasponia andersonii]|uniref:RNase H type-1 domain-containing protein n=1 Tax=Parasponia andersonii TaxID=3476 RepID=A0A2P5AI43_PARAD|nr:hypothetical protein PanWU01x14_330240 [Parasponia andersonii]